ncbi:DUF559 domain-containing protein [Mycobacterium sp. NPDC050551]|uniref:DUF559 domain-containing protein n=1 Tax=Mycobacterium sp. NPDC050551 TaxID=3155407 RepID=UPI003423468E
MGRIFRGSEALTKGAVTRYELQRWHRRIFPDVYCEKSAMLSLRDRIYAAWLSSDRRAVVAGLAAAKMWGASYIDDDIPVELIWQHGRPPVGIVARNEALGDDEITRFGRVPVTSNARTAFDLGRRLPRIEAVARLDALMWSCRLSSEDVILLAKRYPRARGLKALRIALPLVDGGADSPKESWLRLLLIDAGYPTPETQIPVYDGEGLIGVVDMGWEDLKIAVEYDGDHHRSNRRQYVKDQRRIRRLEAAGWIVIRVISEDSVDDILRRVEDAWRRRGRPRH